jgi:hypothetical protein
LYYVFMGFPTYNQKLSVAFFVYRFSCAASKETLGGRGACGAVDKISSAELFW